VHYQMRGMRLDGNALVRGFARADAVGENDVSQQDLPAVRARDRAEQVAVDHGKGEDVGRLVLRTVSGVQRFHLVVVGEADGDFHDQPGLVEGGVAAARRRGADRSLGKRDPIRASAPFPADVRFNHDHAFGPS